MNFVEKAYVGYHCKKSKIFPDKDVEKFINETPDNVHLAANVIFIIIVITIVSVIIF